MKSHYVEMPLQIPIIIIIIIIIINCGTPTEFIKVQGDAYLVYLKLSTKKKLDILQAISARLFNLVI